ncbi:MAG: hypothetical protein KatS3mg076_0912 [Candidatus Binatia bacterium]|nr:MAG: hypothetical protein KatS3mg076_0912 [Candidatus Binatia bacterium]
MIQVAGGGADLERCPSGDADGDEQIREDDLRAAIASIFGACTAEVPVYDVIRTSSYDFFYPVPDIPLAQAAAIATALEEFGPAGEDELRPFVGELLAQSGVAERIGQVVVYSYDERASQDCEECLATCPARPEGCCVRSPGGDCFCFTRLPTDPPERTAVLVLEEAADELAALDVFRAACRGSTLLSGGVNDLFGPTVGGEPTMPSTGLAALIAQNSTNPPANFDTMSPDRHFGHSFFLPSSKCVFGARAVLRAAPLSSSPFPGSRNDVIHLGFVSPAGQFTGAHWAAYFGTGNTGLPVLLPKQWVPGNYPLPQGATFVLNLAALPGGTSLLSDLDSRRFLDVYVQDDTALDHIDLLVKLCPCPEPTPEPCGLDPDGFTCSGSCPRRGQVCTLRQDADGCECRAATPTPTPTSKPCGVEFEEPGVLFCSGACPNAGEVCVLTGPELCECRPATSTPTRTARRTGTPTKTPTPTRPATATPTRPPSPTPTPGPCGFVAFRMCGGFCPNPTDVCVPLPDDSGCHCVPSSPITPTGTPTVSLTPTRPPTATPTRSPSVTASAPPTVTPTAVTPSTPTVTPTCVGLPNGAVGWWPLDEPSGATAIADLSGSGNHGVPQPGPVNTTFSNGPVTVAGQVGSALSFFSGGEFVEVPHSSAFDLASTDLTIDAWFGAFLPGTPGFGGLPNWLSGHRPVLCHSGQARSEREQRVRTCAPHLGEHATGQSAQRFSGQRLCRPLLLAGQHGTLCAGLLGNRHLQHGPAAIPLASHATLAVRGAVAPRGCDRRPSR